MALVELKDLSVSYHNNLIIDKISGSFKKGSLTAIAGENGVGKSTLLKAIAGIIKPKSGLVKIDVDDKKIAYLPQTSQIEKTFPISLLHLVTSGYYQKFGGFGAIDSEMKKHALEVINEVGLSGLEYKAISNLSAGQFRRALFARLIIQDANLILLDEPFAGVDFPTTNKLLEIIKKWHEEGRTIICILHDLEQIKNHFKDCLTLGHKCHHSWNKQENIILNKIL